MSDYAGEIPALPARATPISLGTVIRHALHVALGSALPVVALAGAVGVMPPIGAGIGATIIVLAIGAVETAARAAGVRVTTIRAGDKPDALGKPDRGGRVLLLDARDQPDPASWPVAIKVIKGASIICTVRAPDANIAKYAAQMGQLGDSVLIIACAESDALGWRALIAMHQRGIGSFGQATRSAA